MNKKLLLWGTLILFSLALTLGFAGNRGEGRNASGGERQKVSQELKAQERTQEQLRVDEHENDADRVRKQDRDRVQENEKDQDLCYISSDGEEYQWRRQYTYRLKRYENTDDQEAVNRCLNRIANKYRFKHDEDKEGFVTWAKENRPWDTAQ
jgi:hypothetical protein